MKKLAWFLLALWSISVLTGCNTLRGFGKDIEKAGEGLQKSTE